MREISNDDGGLLRLIIPHFPLFLRIVWELSINIGTVRAQACTWSARDELPEPLTGHWDECGEELREELTIRIPISQTCELNRFNV